MSNLAGALLGKAFYEYKAKAHDELSFDRGSVVEIISKDWCVWLQCVLPPAASKQTNAAVFSDEDGWVYGKINGDEGLIPANYVRLVGEEPNEIAGAQIELSEERVGDGGSSYVFKGRWSQQEVALKVPKGVASLDEKIDGK